MSLVVTNIVAGEPFMDAVVAMEKIAFHLTIYLESFNEVTRGLQKTFQAGQSYHDLVTPVKKELLMNLKNYSGPYLDTTKLMVEQIVSLMDTYEIPFITFRNEIDIINEDAIASATTASWLADSHANIYLVHDRLVVKARNSQEILYDMIRGDAHSQDLKFPYIVLKIKACIKPTNNQEKSVIISLIIILGVVLLSCRMGMNSVDFIPNLISKINRTDSISNITQTNETAQTYKTVPTYKTAEEVNAFPNQQEQPSERISSSWIGIVLAYCGKFKYPLITCIAVFIYHKCEGYFKHRRTEKKNLLSHSKSFEENIGNSIRALDEVIGPMTKHINQCNISISEVAYHFRIICENVKFLAQQSKYSRTGAIALENHFNLMKNPCRRLKLQCDKFHGVIPIFEMRLKQFLKNVPDE